MKYTGQDIKIENIAVKQVNVAKAKEAYDAKKRVWMHPCKLRLNNAWQNPFSFQKQIDLDFYILVDEATIYNCDSERGQYLNYFIQK
tara:strand:+ start:240 stop:500 length:261 start_codon:yes stop_codon:yes gene_type:complete